MSRSAHSRPARRLSAFYAAISLVTAIQLPFWPVWLAARGLTAGEIGTVLAAAIWVKVLARPAIGATAGRAGKCLGGGLVIAAAGALYWTCVGGAYYFYSRAVWGRTGWSDSAGPGRRRAGEPVARPCVWFTRGILARSVAVWSPSTATPLNHRTAPRRHAGSPPAGMAPFSPRDWGVCPG